jgi:pantoate--beta-alanine ligase
MKTLHNMMELRTARRSMPPPVGLVPTMGYLHEGHLSLVKQARRDCASVIVSIFVNPTQFGPQEDFEAYPRDIPRDLGLLEEIGVDAVWMPEVDDLYAPDFQTWVIVEDVAKPLEGKMRPGHFKGVTTIVAKLFTAVQPDKAYFGQKDAQQVVVIRRMVKDLNFPIEVEVCPIVRETDGLAMSSRNVYLNPREREAATVLFRGLKRAKDEHENSSIGAEELRDIMADTINQEPLAHMQYVSCANPDTLEELTGPITWALLSMAVLIGKTRLIDNILIGK